MLGVRTVGEESPPRVEIAALQPDGVLLRQGFPLANVNHSQTAEVAVLSAERSVDDRDVLDQLRAESFQGAQVALSMALRSLILLNVVHQDLETAVHASVIQIEAEPADLERFAAAFLLPGVDAGIEHMKELIVARE